MVRVQALICFCIIYHTQRALNLIWNRPMRIWLFRFIVKLLFETIDWQLQSSFKLVWIFKFHISLICNPLKLTTSRCCYKPLVKPCRAQVLSLFVASCYYQITTGPIRALGTCVLCCSEPILSLTNHNLKYLNSWNLAFRLFLGLSCLRNLTIQR